ncbi:PQQ-binding-like beta-propeller repeat protein [Nocardiopsis sp. MG754419]|uniref:PQQ-binding-like beta-propeller repeat protein n=1 Tax=Nocardiopsis sp. MG754419 TaxID=2259865 RepID=UPI001BA8E3E9|nr:PQQ-binding-like beta-propeller repeat protein [Nocardiopsis sp. MG754419]MBR8742357.1 hypothetical protein [Nocardiopsis sp. MG754419]
MTVETLSRHVWLLLRALSVVTLTLVLWQRAPLPALALPLLLVPTLHALRAPGDPPGPRRHVNPVWVFLADLVSVAVLFTSTTLLFRGLPWQVPAALAAVCLGALVLRWRATEDPTPYPLPPAEPRRHPATVVPAVLMTLAMFAGLIATVTWHPLREHLACTGATSTPGPADWWNTTPAWSSLPEEYPAPEWQRLLDDEVPRSLRHVGASVRAHTLVTDAGVVALSAEDGTALWHLDATYLAGAVVHGDDRSFDEARVVHAGSTVLVEYVYPRTGRDRERPGPLLMAFDDLTGEQVWCRSGIHGVLSGLDSTERFVAWVGEEPTLFDATDGSVVASLDGGPDTPVGPEVEDPRAVIDDGRVLMWEGTRLTTFALETGAELFTLEDVGPGRPESGPRTITSVIASDGTTVVGFDRDHRGRPPSARHAWEYDAEGYLAAYGPDGDLLWDSTGDGVVEEGGPLIGGEPAHGELPARTVFDGHVLVRNPHSDRPAFHGVSLRDGTVTWRLEEEGSPACSASEGTVLDGGRLYRPHSLVTSRGCPSLEDSPVERVFGAGDGMVTWSRHEDGRLLSSLRGAATTP